MSKTLILGVLFLQASVAMSEYEESCPFSRLASGPLTVRESKKVPVILDGAVLPLNNGEFLFERGKEFALHKVANEGLLYLGSAEKGKKARLVKNSSYLLSRYPIDGIYYSNPKETLFVACCDSGQEFLDSLPKSQRPTFVPRSQPAYFVLHNKEGLLASPRIELPLWKSRKEMRYSTRVVRDGVTYGTGDPYEFQNIQRNEPDWVSFSPNGQFIFALSNYGEYFVFETATRKLIHSYLNPDSGFSQTTEVFTQMNVGGERVYFQRNKYQLLADTFKENHQLDIFNVRPEKVRREKQFEELDPKTHRPTGKKHVEVDRFEYIPEILLLSAAPTGESAVFIEHGYDRSQIRLWKPPSADLMTLGDAPVYRDLVSVTYSKDGTQILRLDGTLYESEGSQFFGITARRYDSHTGAQLEEFLIRTYVDDLKEIEALFSKMDILPVPGGWMIAADSVEDFEIKATKKPFILEGKTGAVVGQSTFPQFEGASKVTLFGIRLDGGLKVFGEKRVSGLVSGLTISPDAKTLFVKLASYGQDPLVFRNTLVYTIE